VVAHDNAGPFPQQTKTRCCVSDALDVTLFDHCLDPQYIAAEIGGEEFLTEFAQGAVISE